jgi:chromosome segregation ATPase
MKSKLAVIFLVLLSIGMGVGLIVRHKQADTESKSLLGHVLQLSNQVVSTRLQLEEQQSVNMELRTNLATRKIEISSVSNNLAAVSANFSKLQVEAKAAADLAAIEMAKRDSKISELQGQNDDMTKKMGDLSTSLTNLNTQIIETERKLTASEGDREFLMKELRRLQAEKTELERQFNDLALLRDQVRKLKEELSISRRLEWLRQGIYGNLNKKGGERLTEAKKVEPTNAVDSSLNVELRQDGGVKIESKIPAAETNAPASPPK